MTKRVGIITTHRARNVGAALQAFSLCTVVRQIGFECEVIDYWPSGIAENHLAGIRKLNVNIQKILFQKQVRRSVEAYEKFLKHIPIGARRYYAPNELSETINQYDIFITGSDQIWNPNQFPINCSGPYFLDFVPLGAARQVAYAASFGHKSLSTTTDHEQRMKENILKYDYISVREEHGVDIVFKLTGRKAAHVLDPTLLIDVNELESLCEPKRPEEDYIFVYPTQQPPSFDSYKIIRNFASKNRMKIIMQCSPGIHPLWLTICDRALFDVGPIEFLEYIRNSKYVITNSFHGTALAIAFRKKFSVIPHSVYNSRMESLLKTLNLTDRLLCDGRSLADLLSEMSAMRYDDASSLHEAHRQYSMDYLLKSIS